MPPDPSRPAQLTRPKTSEPWLAAMPAVFVLLWSTGFIGAKLGSPFAPPFTFLLLRFAIVVAALTLAASGCVGARSAVAARVAGAAPHRFGGRANTRGISRRLFLAISVGVPAGIAALIVSLQPLGRRSSRGPIWTSGSVLGSGWALYSAFLASPLSLSTNSPGEGRKP